MRRVVTLQVDTPATVDIVLELAGLAEEVQVQAEIPMLNTVDRIDRRSRWTVYPQVDCQDGVAIAIDLCKLIKARSVQDGFGVIGCQGVLNASAGLIYPVSCRPTGVGAALGFTESVAYARAYKCNGTRTVISSAATQGCNSSFWPLPKSTST